MKKSTAPLKLFALLLICSFLGCNVSKKSTINSPKEKAINLNELSTSNEIDFSKIKEWVKDKRVVSLGESAHGIGEFYTLKSEIVQFLHKEMGFDVIAIEGSIGDLTLAWNDVDNLSAEELRSETLFGNFQCEEIAPLYTYIKEQSKTDRPLHYTGFDTQLSSNYFKTKLVEISKYLDLKIDLEEELSYYFKMFQASSEADSTNFTNYKKRYLNTVSTLQKEVEKNQKTIKDFLKWSDLDVEISLRTLDMLYKSVDYNFANKYDSNNNHQAFILRDKYMAENIEWIMTRMYPNKKIILWGHNGHIQKGRVNNNDTKWMGQHLKQNFGDDYFSIGLFAYQGKAYHQWTGKSLDIFNPDSTALEQNMNPQNFKYSFQRFSNPDKDNWTNQQATAMEIESNGIVYFIPSERFDAAICIKDADIPSFSNQK